MHTSPKHADAIKQNVSTFSEMLSRVGAPSLSLTYAGGGDSGSVEDCVIDWPGGVAGQEPEKIAFVGVRTDYSGKTLRYYTETSELSFSDACDALLDLVLEQHGHSGWEDGNGGGGTLTLTAEGALRVDHYDVVEVHEEDTIEYAAPPKPAPLERPSPLIEQSESSFQVAF